MRKNTLVEELLRRLPGLHVDPDGSITYNGERIQHLLVDGEDIFGSDPTLVTRNFDASKIARVQIMDRRDDQSIFTGIDDGSRIKTLNLILKESAKDGYFGKMQVGGDADTYYNFNAGLAEFRKKEQFTALGLVANTGLLNFNGDGSASSSSISFVGTNTDALGASAGMGIPRFDALALHYSNTFGQQDNHLTANYQLGNYFSQPQTSTNSIQAQVDSIYEQSEQSRSVNKQIQHWGYGIYDWDPSRNSLVRFTFHLNTYNGQNKYTSLGSSTFNDTLVNTSQRSINDTENQDNIGGGIAWRTKIGKESNRNFSITTGVAKIDNTTNGYLHSINHYYKPNGILLNVDTINQRKQITTHSLNLIGSLNYTQLLIKKISFGLSYRASYTGDSPLQETFDQVDGKYQQMIDSLSKNLVTRAISQQAIINLQGEYGKFHYSIGSDWQSYVYRQHDLISDSFFQLNYNILTPRAQLSYNLKQESNFGFNLN